MTERNNGILARLDERTESILRELESIGKRHDATNAHLERLNGKTEKTAILSGKNRTHINIQWWFIAAIVLGLMACGFKFIGVY